MSNVSRLSVGINLLSRMSNPKTVAIALLVWTLLVSGGVEAAERKAQEKSFDDFMKSCGDVVTEIYTDPEVSSLLPSPTDSVNSTCSCMAGQLSTDRKFQKMFADSNSGSQNESESKKTQAFLVGRFMSVVFACMSVELDKAVNGIGPRGVG